MTLTDATVMLLTTVLLLCSSFTYPTTAAEAASSDGGSLSGVSTPTADVENNGYENQKSTSAVAQPSSTRRAAQSAKIFAIGGGGVEIFDTETKVWSSAADLPFADGSGAVILDGAVCASTEFGGVQCFNASANEWKRGPFIFFKTGSTFVSYNKSIYAFGGRDRGEEPSRGVRRINPTTGRWTSRANMSTERTSFGACVLGDRIYVVGGKRAHTRYGSVLSSVEKYDPLRDRWSTVRSMNTRRTRHSVVCTGGKVYAIGDEDSLDSARTAEAYDPRTNRWQMIAAMSQPRRGAGAVGFDGHIYVIGGEDYHGHSGLDLMEVYDVESDTWTVSPHRMARARSGLAVALLRVGATDEDVEFETSVRPHQRAQIEENTPKLFAIGGWTTSVSERGHYSWSVKTVEMLDFETQTWTRAPDLGQWLSSLGLSAASLDGVVYALGGYGFIAFNTTTNEWSAEPLTSMHRALSALVAFKQKIYAIGGLDVRASVYSFDPSTGSWSQRGSMSTARHSFGACVLGEHIYAVGGADSSLSRLRSVEKYDGARDEWSPIMPMNHARSKHAVACTGGKVYAIGGFDDANFKSVEVYDPSTNQWQLASELCKPRMDFGAIVYDGNIYVVGGQTNVQSGDYHDSMEIYSPENDTWTVSPHRMAANRHSHAVAFLAAKNA